MNYWKDLFREHILARGELYYYDGAVQELEKTEHGYHAVVEGTEDYEVDIEMEDGQICEMYCTCPYADDGNNCKHMAAPLVQSRRKKSWRKLLKRFRKRNCALLSSSWPGGTMRSAIRL